MRFPLYHQIAATGRFGLACCLCACLPIWLSAQGPGQQDLGFGQAGWLRIDLDTFDASVAVASDVQDRLVLLANAAHADSNGVDMDIVLLRRLPDGEADASFGDGGALRFDFDGYGYSEAKALAAMPDGRWALLGTGTNAATPNHRHFVLQMRLADGALDSTWGEAGQADLAFMGEDHITEALRATADGKLLLAGATYDSVLAHLEYPCIGRLDAHGRPDSSFGHTGLLALNYQSGLSDARTTHSNGGCFYDLLEIPDGRILCGGSMLGSTSYVCALVLLSPDGRIDSSFHDTGILSWDISPGCNNYVRHLVGFEDGSFGLQLFQDCWYVAADQNYFRMALDDAADLPWNQDGGLEEQAGGLLRDQGDWVLLSGRARQAGRPNGWYSDAFSLCRVNAQTGAADAQFGQGGWFQAVYDSSRQCGAEALTQQSDGRIVLAGFTTSDPSIAATDLLLTRVQAGLPTAAPSPAVTHPSLRAYPNPARDHVWIEAGHQPAEVQLWSGEGRLLRTWQGVSGTTSLDLGGLAAGIYVLRLHDKSQTAQMRLVVAGE